MITPHTDDGLRMYDDLDPTAAVTAAWSQPGPRPDWHSRAQRQVHDSMPLLGRALDRLAAEPSDSAWRVRAEAAERIIRALMTAEGVLHADGRHMVAAHERRYKVRLTGGKRK